MFRGLCYGLVMGWHFVSSFSGKKNQNDSVQAEEGIVFQRSIDFVEIRVLL